MCRPSVRPTIAPIIDTSLLPITSKAFPHHTKGDELASAKSMTAEAQRKQTLKAVKRDWYQTETHVIITILIKKVVVADVNIDYGDDTLRFSVKIPNTDVTYDLQLLLAKKIAKEQCVFKVTPSKIEIKLKKGGGWSGT